MTAPRPARTLAPLRSDRLAKLVKAYVAEQPLVSDPPRTPLARSLAAELRQACRDVEHRIGRADPTEQPQLLELYNIAYRIAFRQMPPTLFLHNHLRPLIADTLATAPDSPRMHYLLRLATEFNLPSSPHP